MENRTKFCTIYQGTLISNNPSGSTDPKSTPTPEIKNICGENLDSPNRENWDDHACADDNDNQYYTNICAINKRQIPPLKLCENNNFQNCK